MYSRRDSPYADGGSFLTIICFQKEGRRCCPRTDSFLRDFKLTLRSRSKLCNNPEKCSSQNTSCPLPPHYVNIGIKSVTAHLLHTREKPGVHNFYNSHHLGALIMGI
jgi:hypothetical protein